MQGNIEMKTKLLTAAMLMLSVVAAGAATDSLNGGADNSSTASAKRGDGSSGKEDNQGYLAGPKFRHTMIRTSNRPFWHGMSSRRSHHHWWEFWD
jgi:hypothetical protein